MVEGETAYRVFRQIGILYSKRLSLVYRVWGAFLIAQIFFVLRYLNSNSLSCLGKQSADWLGIRHYQFRLVDWYRTRGTLISLISAVNQMAHVNQPFSPPEAVTATVKRQDFPLLLRCRGLHGCFRIRYNGNVAPVSQSFDMTFSFQLMRQFRFLFWYVGLILI